MTFSQEYLLFQVMYKPNCFAFKTRIADNKRTKEKPTTTYTCLSSLGFTGED